MMLLYIILDNVFNFIKEMMTLLQKPDTSQDLTIAFWAFGIILIGLLAIIGRIMSSSTESKIIWLVELVVLLIYYICGNVYSIIHQYGDNLHCTNDCQDICFVITITGIPVGLLIHLTVSLKSKKQPTKPGKEWAEVRWSSVANIVSGYIAASKFSSLVIITLSSTSLSLPNRHCVISVAVATIIIVGVINIILKCPCGKCNPGSYCCDLVMISSVMILMFTLPLHILSSHHEPLANHLFESKEQNSTSNMQSLDKTTFMPLTRAFFLFVSAVLLLILSFILYCAWRNDKKYINYQKLEQSKEP